VIFVVQVVGARQHPAFGRSCDVKNLKHGFGFLAFGNHRRGMDANNMIRSAAKPK
jgi:hypothetical protein